MGETVKISKEAETQLNELGKGKGHISIEDLIICSNYLVEQPTGFIYQKFGLKAHEIVGALKMLNHFTGKNL